MALIKINIYEHQSFPPTGKKISTFPFNCHPSIHVMSGAKVTSTTWREPHLSVSQGIHSCTVCRSQTCTWTPQRASAHLQPVLPRFVGSRPTVCAKSHVARRERSPEKQGRKEEGGVEGTRSKTQEVEKDEERGDNVMHTGAGVGVGGEWGARAEEKEEESWKRRRRRTEQQRESTGCVHLALGGRER